MALISTPGYQCDATKRNGDKCGHKWSSRNEGDPLPKICPKCKSKDWNKKEQSSNPSV